MINEKKVVDTDLQEDETEDFDSCYEGFIGGYGNGFLERDDYDPDFDL